MISLESEISLEEWADLNEKDQGEVLDLLLYHYDEETPLYKSMELNSKRAFELFQSEYKGITGIKFVGPAFAVDCEFDLWIEHSILCDFRLIPRKYLNFRVQHYVYDAPKKCITVLNPGDKVLPKKYIARAIKYYGRKIAKSWGHDVSVDEVLKEYSSRLICGLLMFSTWDTMRPGYESNLLPPDENSMNNAIVNS